MKDCTVCKLTIKKRNDQRPLFFFPLRKMNAITYVKKIRDVTYPILHRIWKENIKAEIGKCNLGKCSYLHLNFPNYATATAM